MSLGLSKKQGDFRVRSFITCRLHRPLLLPHLSFSPNLQKDNFISFPRKVTIAVGNLPDFSNIHIRGTLERNVITYKFIKCRNHVCGWASLWAGHEHTFGSDNLCSASNLWGLVLKANVKQLFFNSYVNQRHLQQQRRVRRNRNYYLSTLSDGFMLHEQILNEWGANRKKR